MEPEIFTWSTFMLAFSSEVALEMSLRLERQVGPIAEICEAVSPTFSSLPFRTKTGTGITPESIGARPKTQGVVLQIQKRGKKDKETKKDDWDMDVIPLKDLNVNEMNQKS